MRVASAAVLAPVALAAVWAGGVWLTGLVLAATLAMSWEWARLAGGGGFGPAALGMLACGIVVIVGVSLGLSIVAVVLAAVIGAAGIFVLARASHRADPVWAAAGTIWIVLGAAAFLRLALPPATGRQTAVWLLGLVWANDVAAYVIGRGIGGPKLAPRLSPNKTWAGFFGGVACAGWVGVLLSRDLFLEPAMAAGTSLGLAIAAQLGDLAESLGKRHFGVKDSSGLIPGHGGVLDRLDGLLAASLAAGLAAATAGRSPLAW